jgi:hypothetical protein
MLTQHHSTTEPINDSRCPTCGHEAFEVLFRRCVTEAQSTFRDDALRERRTRRTLQRGDIPRDAVHFAKECNRSACFQALAGDAL